MRSLSLRALALLCCFGLLFGCARTDPAPSSTPSAPPPSSAASSPSSPASSEPEPQPPTRPDGDYLLHDGVLYWSEGPIHSFEALLEPQYTRVGTISRVTDQPEQEGDATFGAAGGALYCESPTDYEPNSFALLYEDGEQLWVLYPTAPTAAVSSDEQDFIDAAQQLALILASGDGEGLARLAQIDNQAALYNSLAQNDISVVQTVYSGRTNPVMGGYTAYYDIEVGKPGLLPVGRQRLMASFFGVDPRRPSLRPDELRLSSLTLYREAAPLTDPDPYGWEEVGSMVTYRIDMPFSSPSELPPHLLLRVVVPFAYGRAVLEGNGIAAAITVQQVKESARLLFGLEDFAPQDPNYYDAATGTYTLKNHGAVTAGMGHSMDYLDPGLNFLDETIDRDDGRVVIVTHYADPLRLIPARVLEYRVEPVEDALSGRTIGRVLSATLVE